MLTPEEFEIILDQYPHCTITVNYSSGNSPIIVVSDGRDEAINQSHGLAFVKRVADILGLIDYEIATPRDNEGTERKFHLIKTDNVKIIGPWFQEPNCPSC